jgi:transcriptional regulator with PAS, ATPase and Fis domain
VIARVIHYHSPIAESPFVEVNCTSLPENLIESELFGHEKSAFTDAKAMKRGLFELADGGTIFLDEIGDMSMSTQAKLLRVVEGKAFKRVGGVTDINVDVRIIGATNKKLAEAVKQGTFREDLYYRLMVIPVYLSPLRERRDDIIPLVKFFIDEFSKKIRGRIKKISREAEDLLIGYSWPGNVRELKNILERISILETGETLMAEHLPEELKGNRFELLDKGSPAFILPESGISLENVERNLIKQALNVSMGNQSNASKLLSLSRDTFRYRMKKFGLD